MSNGVLPTKVLFADDDRSMRVAFTNAARLLGVEAVVVESGAQALEQAQQATFPVVIAELRMPGIGGLALIERLSALDRSTAFVLVSAEPELSGGLSSRADGAIASLLRKPWDLDDFRSTLERAFALHKRRSQRARRSIPPPSWSVLIVDDSDAGVARLEEYLSELPGLSLEHVNRLQDAVRVLHDREFDSIITELCLPDARGFDSVLRLQASAPGAAVLAYCAVEDEALALQVVQLGAQDFLPKSSTDRKALLRALRFARERKRAELRLRRLAHYDQLTGLSNRASFNESLTHAVSRAHRRGQMLALMMIDLDGFKEVNDRLGHDAGDRVLQEVGVRLRCLFREYDVVARFGGDEFAVLIGEIQNRAELAHIAERLLASIAAPIWIRENHAQVSASIGIAVFPDAGLSPGKILKAADLAMYAAKRNGRSQYVFFSGTANSSLGPVPESLAPSGRRPAPSSALVPGRVPSEFTIEPSPSSEGALSPSLPATPRALGAAAAAERPTRRLKRELSGR